MSDDYRIDIATIRCGDFFWECEAGENCQLEAMADAVVHDGVVTVQTRVVSTNEPLALMQRIGFESYGPRLYRMPEYVGPGAKTR